MSVKQITTQKWRDLMDEYDQNVREWMRRFYPSVCSDPLCCYNAACRPKEVDGAIRYIASSAPVIRGENQ